MLNGALESLVQKVQGGVVINFEKIGPDPPIIEVKVENGLDSNGNSKGILFPKINISNIKVWIVCETSPVFNFQLK